jgi:hypothetical protein
MNKLVKQVNFQDVNMTACKTEDKIFVGIKSICEGLGVDTNAQTQRINRDDVLPEGVCKIHIPTASGVQETNMLNIEYLPFFLIGIKSSMCTEEVRPRLKEFKLKAKDVLAQAFVNRPLTPQQELKLHYQVLESQQEDIKEVKADIKDIRENSPLYNIECDELQKLVKKIGTKELGGHGSNAYKNKSLRTKVYADIQHELKREFGVSSYKAIKRCQLATAREIVSSYKVPIVLQEQIVDLNNQISMGVM